MRPRPRQRLSHARGHNVERATAGLEAQFAQLLDLSRLEANAFAAAIDRDACRARRRCSRASSGGVRSRRPPPHAGCACAWCPRRLVGAHSDPALVLLRMLQQPRGECACATPSRGGVVARRAAAAARRVAIDCRRHRHPGIAPAEHRERISSRSSTRWPTRAQASGPARGWAWALPSCGALPRICSGHRGLSDRVATRPWLALSRARAPAGRSTGQCAHCAMQGALPASRPPRPDAIDGVVLVAVLDDDPAAIEGMRALFTAWGAERRGRRRSLADALLDAIGRCLRQLPGPRSWPTCGLACGLRVRSGCHRAACATNSVHAGAGAGRVRRRECRGRARRARGGHAAAGQAGGRGGVAGAPPARCFPPSRRPQPPRSAEGGAGSEGKEPAHPCVEHDELAGAAGEDGGWRPRDRRRGGRRRTVWSRETVIEACSYPMNPQVAGRRSCRGWGTRSSCRRG